MIGIFDSGIGGVTVFREIIKEMPNYKYIYYSDSLNNPYGDKENDALIKIVDNIVNYLINEGCQIIVIACNTASAICKDYLRNKYDIPIIAIEPAIKQVYDQKTTEKTLLLATKGTIDSEKFKELYEKYDNHAIYLKECHGLADLIEDNNEAKIKEYLELNLKEFKGVQNVILGCTHYPLIEKEIKSVLGNVNIYHGALGVVKELKRIITSKNIKETKKEIIFIDSSKNKKKEERFWQLLNNQEYV